MKTSKIIASSYFVPDKRLTHEELEKRFGKEDMSKIAQSSGILERRVVGSEECASDLAIRASEDLFAHYKIDRSSIDLILFATQTPDYLLPTTACILQNKLGLPKKCGAFDINLGCSQYLYSLATAHAYICAGLANRVLVLTGDTVTRIINPKDRSVVPLFGDAGTATIMDLSTDEYGGFIDFEMGTNGEGFNHLLWPTSGMRETRTKESQKEKVFSNGSVRSSDDMYMDGAAIFVFTLKIVPDLVLSLLSKSNLSVEDIDLFIFHQASELIIESSAKKLKIPKEKLHYKLHDVGNSGGSTVCIAMTDAWLKGKIKPGQKIVLVAFGVGLSWGAALIEWPQEALGPVCKVNFENGPERPPNQQ